MIASWPQVALRGSSCLANASACAPVCSIGNVRNRRLSRVNPQQKVEAARLQEAAPELRPSTLPEAWERSSLSDEGIREALRARTKHYASQEESQQADSSSISPERSVLSPPYLRSEGCPLTLQLRSSYGLYPCHLSPLSILEQA